MSVFQKMKPRPSPENGFDFDIGDLHFNLSPFQISDASQLLRWISNPGELYRLAPKTNWPLTLEKIRDWGGPGCQAFSLSCITGTHCSRSLIGYGEVNWLPGAPQQAWLGHIILDPSLRGRGLGCVLVQALLQQAFCYRLANKVCLIVFPQNLPAVNCYRRVGFHQVGEEKHRCGAKGTYEILLRFEMTRADFESTGLTLS